MPELRSADLDADLSIPLCVDLDGTLVKSDTFHDSLCLLVRRDPANALRAPGWLLSGGKAGLKQAVARHIILDPAHLPYNRTLLRYLREQKLAGRKIYLATGADRALAERVATHLGLFSGVLASDGETNLIGNSKLAAIQAAFPQFDYVGNARPDLPLLAQSRRAMLANPTGGLRRGMRRMQRRAPSTPGAKAAHPTEHFIDREAIFPTVLRALRVHQWAKNLLLFFPLLLSHYITVKNTLEALAAFFCFSLTASATYLFNDMLDVESDRHHPKKRMRPFAAGNLTVPAGLGIAALLAAVACSLLPLLPLEFAAWMLVYLVATLAYSFHFKRIRLVDVLMLAGLYTLRIEAGGAATDTPISPWLSSFAIFLFLSLAMVKRFSELANLRERGAATAPGRGYLVSDMEQIRSFGTCSAYAAVVVFSLYISRPDVDALYRHAGRLWLVLPCMLYWVNRVWLLASRGEMSEDPVLFATRDRVSLAIGALVVALALFAIF